MPATFQALAVALVAVLPGAAYIWAVERQTGSWGIKASDRVLRFVGVSAGFLALYAVPLRWIWIHYLHQPVAAGEKVRYVNVVADGGSLPALWWAVPLLYVAIPFFAGTVVGHIVGQRQKWPRLSRWVSGPNPAPRAWDDLFSRKPAAYIRLRLKTEQPKWVAGVFGKNSYASGYGEAPEDIFLESGLRLTADGSFQRDDAGKVIPTGSGLLVKREDVDIIEVIDRRGNGEWPRPE